MSKKNNSINCEENQSIKHWREDDRPRERLIKYGTTALADSELLAILLGSGSVGRSVIDVSRELLKEFSSLSNMAKCSTSQFQKIEGIGIDKAVLLSAAFELTRRVNVSPYLNNKQFLSIEELANYYIPRLRDLRVEQFRIVLLNSQNYILKDYIVSEGILNQTLVHPREVFRPAILESAASVVLIHNHTSGDVNPSNEDKEITKRLISTGEIIGIKVLDHIIISRTKYFSFKQMGLM